MEGNSNKNQRRYL